MSKRKYSGTELLETAPVGTAIIRLALPMMAAMLAQAVYNMTDMYFIGQTDDPDKVAAISITFPLFMLSQALGNVFAVGGSGYISRLLGAKGNGEARRSSAVALYTSFGAGILTSIALLAFKTPTLRLVGSSDAVLPHADSYFSVVLLFMAFAASNVVMSALMRSEGAAKKAMTLQLIGITLNIVLDPLFILKLNMGTAGAAWATAAGQIASFVYGVRYFLSKETILSIKPKAFQPNSAMLFQILSVGIPAGLSNVIMSVSHVFSNRVLASYGDAAVAGGGVQMRINSLFFMLIMALAQGYQPFAGYNYGAGQYARLRKGFKLTLLSTTGLCLIGGVILYLFGSECIRFFINDQKTVETGGAIMRAFAFGLPFVGPQVLIMTTFQALGKPVQATVITMGRKLLFFVPLLYILNRFYGLSGVIWSQPVSEILTTGIAAVLGLSLLGTMRETRKEEIRQEAVSVITGGS